MIKNIKKSIIFDFDGVVCDSINECLVTSFNTWFILNNKNEFRKKINEFRNEEKNSFTTLFPYVRAAGEYYILHRLIDNDLFQNINQYKFEKYKNLWKSELKEFEFYFLQQREKLRNENLQDWIDLHIIFQDVLEVMQKLNKDNRVYIATLKDAESVQLILESRNLKIPDAHILDYSKISTKLEALNYFVNYNKLDKSSLIFLDDNINHLIEPRKAGFDVFLTFWCNQVSEFKSVAESHNIPLLNNIKELNL